MPSFTTWHSEVSCRRQPGPLSSWLNTLHSDPPESRCTFSGRGEQHFTDSVKVLPSVPTPPVAPQ